VVELEATERKVTVGAETLQADLLAVPGVASADVETNVGDAPAGVKVRLDADADARRVGVEVQRILAAHGMRSRFSGTDQAVEESAPPPAPEPSRPSTPVRSTPPPAAPTPPAPDQPPPVTAIPNPPTIDPPTIDPPSIEPPSTIAALRSVSVEERADGRTALVVLDDGRQAAQATGSGAEDLDSAVVAAITEAAGVAATLVVVEWTEVEQGSVATVVAQDADGTLLAGAAAVRIGRAFAVGKAAHAALSA
jgi:hypothetical protein